VRMSRSLINIKIIAIPASYCMKKKYQAEVEAV